MHGEERGVEKGMNREKEGRRNSERGEKVRKNRGEIGEK